MLHEKLDGVAPGPAAKAVVELFAGADAKARRFVVVEGAETDEIFPLLFEHDMLGDDIDNVGPLFDLLDGVGVEARDVHGGAALGKDYI